VQVWALGFKALGCMVLGSADQSLRTSGEYDEKCARQARVRGSGLVVQDIEARGLSFLGGWCRFRGKRFKGSGCWVHVFMDEGVGIRR
jgi:hypothetical protein